MVKFIICKICKTNVGKFPGLQQHCSWVLFGSSGHLIEYMGQITCELIYCRTVLMYHRLTLYVLLSGPTPFFFLVGIIHFHIYLQAKAEPHPLINYYYCQINI